MGGDPRPCSFPWCGLTPSLDWLPKQRLPKEPWGSALLYRAPHPDGLGPFQLVTLGADGAPGGEDYAADITFPSSP